MVETLNFHIGKNGLTKEFVEHLGIAFKTRKIIKVQLLKSAASDREQMEKTAEEIIKDLPGKYNYRVIGFTIILMKRNLIKIPSKKKFVGRHIRRAAK